ncbi:N-acetylmuramoyl-L-alanine amidase [Pseudahrensia aquimaris]|uniref:N-acetylmuramoyl-L-alanine amidase n=1 Tax=Pseudahrensia aquimaris TaxID=744461 RepID=A0ABW3FH67_9HYPH
MNEVCPAVNFGVRRDNAAPDILLLHYTGMDSAQGALDWLCCEESGVSCHYFVFEDGRTVQLLPEEARAHHAGVSSWHGDTDINSRSIGVEIANAGHSVGEGVALPDFPQAQMDAVLALSKEVVARHRIVPQNVLGHSDVAPGRKLDPGENFDWAWLANNGIGHWIEPTALATGSFFQRGDVGEPVEALQTLLALYGYGIEISGQFDERTETVVAAFQRHFRPQKVDGVADYSTIDTLHKLLKSLEDAGV